MGRRAGAHGVPYNLIKEGALPFCEGDGILIKLDISVKGRLRARSDKSVAEQRSDQGWWSS